MQRAWMNFDVQGYALTLIVWLLGFPIFYLERYVKLRRKQHMFN